jgi:solute carrier family 25 phosphate transporter 23/24/25/41
MLMQAQNSTAMLAGAVNKKLPGTKPSVRPGAVRVAPDAAMRATAPEYRGIWNSLKKIYFESGWKGFYKGNGTNIIKIAPESAVKFWAYESIKRMLCHDSTAPAIKEKLIAGSAAGAISQTVIYPLEITKTRLAVSMPGEYRGILHCIATIIRVDGVSALFRGLLPSVVGVIPYAGVDFAVYSSLRDVYTQRYPDKHPGVLTVFMCGALSSTCGQVVAYPLQLVRTRLQTQGMAGRPMLYKGMSDAFYKIWKCDGLLGFYSGILPNFMKAIPAVSISYIVYEQVSRGLGISSGL